MVKFEYQYCFANVRCQLYTTPEHAAHVPADVLEHEAGPVLLAGVEHDVVSVVEERVAVREVPGQLGGGLRNAHGVEPEQERYSVDWIQP